MARDHATRDHRARGREDLCYLKSGRGYLRNRTDGFVSGATFRDGCNEDPYCDSPYSHYGHQCLLFSNDYWDASLADVRRNINNTRGETTFIIPWFNNICSLTSNPYPLTPLFRGLLRAGWVPAPRLLWLLRPVWLRIRRRVALGGIRRGRDKVSIFSG